MTAPGAEKLDLDGDEVEAQDAPNTETLSTPSQQATTTPSEDQALLHASQQLPFDPQACFDWSLNPFFYSDMPDVPALLSENGFVLPLNEDPYYPDLWPGFSMTTFTG